MQRPHLHETGGIVTTGRNVEHTCFAARVGPMHARCCRPIKAAQLMKMYEVPAGLQQAATTNVLETDTGL
jgi:hypothetical protein